MAVPGGFAPTGIVMRNVNTRIAFAFAAVAALLLPAFATASGCSNDEPYTIGVVQPEAGFYVVNDRCQLDGCGWSVWIYQETNGIPGLQRDDTFKPANGGCQADTVVF
jgi:hypothetical protein